MVSTPVICVLVCLLAFVALARADDAVPLGMLTPLTSSLLSLGYPFCNSQCVGCNLSGLNDYARSLPFIDLIHNSRGFGQADLPYVPNMTVDGTYNRGKIYYYHFNVYLSKWLAYTRLWCDCVHQPNSWYYQWYLHPTMYPLPI
jgi:hypothetical protein